jgi:intraflagellar transport protein 88
LESYRHYPVSLDVISWLGVWYVKKELYEKAIHFFERASQIQSVSHPEPRAPRLSLVESRAGPRCRPGEVKWRLMVTSCHRRMGHFQEALELYEQIHTDYPENLECDAASRLAPITHASAHSRLSL